MLLFPAIFIALMQFAFNSLSTDDSVVDDAITIVFNNTMWTSPEDPKYDTFFGNDPIGWFADNTFVLFAKFGAVLIVVGVTLFPFVDFIAIMPIAITGVLTTIFVFAYAMMIIGGYKTFSPFVGR